MIFKTDRIEPLKYFTTDRIEPLEFFTFDKNELEIINSLFSKFTKKVYVFRELQARAFLPFCGKSKKEQLIENCNFLKERYSDIENEIVVDFIEKNSKSLFIDKDTKFNFKFSWLNNASRGRYPFLDLSRIGFNKDKTKCLFYRGYAVEGLAGDGGFLILQKKNSLWISRENKPVYIGTWRS